MKIANSTNEASQAVVYKENIGLDHVKPLTAFNIIATTTSLGMGISALFLMPTIAAGPVVIAPAVAIGTVAGAVVGAVIVVGMEVHNQIKNYKAAKKLAERNIYQQNEIQDEDFVIIEMVEKPVSLKEVCSNEQEEEKDEKAVIVEESKAPTTPRKLKFFVDVQPSSSNVEEERSHNVGSTH